MFLSHLKSFVVIRLCSLSLNEKKGYIKCSFLIEKRYSSITSIQSLFFCRAKQNEYINYERLFIEK